MAMRVSFCEQPRTLLLASEDYTLSFQCVVDSSDEKREIHIEKSTVPDGSTGYHESQATPPPRVLVDFADASTIDYEKYRALSSLPCFGCLGLISVENDVFLAVITGASKVAEPITGSETVFRIHGVEFYCVSRSTWDFVVLDPAGNPLDMTGASLSADQFDLATAGGGGAAGNPSVGMLEHPCSQLRKLLSDGSFYYSNDFDLTNRLQSRSAEPTFDIDGFDETFMWNSFMISELVTYRSHLQEEEKSALDASRFLTSVIRGFAETVPTRLDRRPATLTVISRQGCRRAGTRYNARGVDDEGNVANFVETETILYTENFCFSYTQIRGSVPIFWEQDIQLLTAKVNITRAFDATQPAFLAHFKPLVEKYGPVHIVNLLSTKPGEHELTQRYHQHIRQAAENPESSLYRRLNETKFDFHVETAKSGYTAANRILRFLQEDAEEFGFFLFDTNTRAMQLEQSGVFRTNCLDCLDRTNLIQQIISKYALEVLFEQKEIRPGPDLWGRHSVLWADNGDQLSKIYAGTGALKTSFTRSGKMSIAGAIADATKSVSRLYINNFVDKGKQNTMDMLLGRLEGQQQVILYDPINDYVTAELNKLRDEFTSSKEISVFVGTFNLNGYLYEGDLSGWLFPEQSGIDDPDLVIVGFQEIVELTPGQILSADPAKRVFWESQVSRCLETRGDYVLLRSGQLVGTALLMYVKKSEVRYVRNINGAMKKTGLGGMAGNKGGVAFSCDYAATKLCFITSHLAAGSTNVEDRNNDYRTIARGIRFPHGRTLRDHDTVFWLGDFNYRVDMPNGEVRKFIREGNLEALYQNDQLNRQMQDGQVFPFFEEAPITFNPTYKYDNGTDIYDTSDKARTPAWTDRILVRGANARQIGYGCGQLMFSDHRPVYATFRVTVHTVDAPVKEELSKQLYARRRGYVGQLVDFNNDDPNRLPPPSTDKQKWWNDGGQSSKIAVVAPRSGMVLNPQRPANPFSFTDQPDFIAQSDSRRTGDIKSTSQELAASAAATSLLNHGLHAPPIPRKPQTLSSHSLHSLASNSPNSELPPPLPPRHSVVASRHDSEPVETPLQTFSGASRQSTQYEDQSFSRASSRSSVISTTPMRRAEFPSASLSKIHPSTSRSSNYGSHTPTSSSVSMSASSSNDSRLAMPTAKFTDTPRNTFGAVQHAPMTSPSFNSATTYPDMPPKLPPRHKAQDAVYGRVSPVSTSARSSPSQSVLDDEDDAAKLNQSWKSLV
ncbi:SacI homology domain-containing protein [Lipomyces arxii]|uniref:SacI homology domain-containing protein n=1 Tax=Lipomyces arxii TaxID=56418 RepID=UPI0034CFB353